MTLSQSIARENVNRTQICPKKILVLGGDGFCGWPTSLHLSSLGHDVAIVDNLIRRQWDEQAGSNSLTPIASIEDRLDCWFETSGRHIAFHKLTLGEDYPALLDLIRTWRPEVVVHLAEQRSAPYSMRGSKEGRFTIRNNLGATHDLLSAIVEAEVDCHVVHLGTMGIYGYGSLNGQIPEGYLEVRLTSGGHTQDIEILYPPDPGSIYHLTKAQDHLLLAFYAKTFQLRVTDLHQGIVWGTQTRETSLDLGLINRFDYDGDFGTVLNRFLVQAAVGHPLTVYGTGRQTRAFLHLRDAVRCIELAIESPARRGERVQVFNQMTETHRIIELAKTVSRLTGAPIELLPNPRLEASDNDLSATNHHLLQLGLSPTLLEEGLLEEISELATRYRSRCIAARIPTTAKWSRTVPSSIAPSLGPRVSA